jgi:hypothetical protein
MIKGIAGNDYINLDPYLDINTVKSLHYKICKGIVQSKYKKEGNIVKPGGFDNAYELTFKPTFQALEEYYALPDDHEIKILGKELGELDNRDEFVLFLKLVLGAYDPYQFIFLKTESGGWDTRFDEKPWTPDAEYFPELKTWIENLIGPVFEHVGRIIIFKAEHDGITALHRDLIHPTETDYTDHRHEFIHLRTRLDRPFYIWDREFDKKVETTAHAIFFNDQDWHNGGTANVQTFSIRIDGKFTEQFRQLAGFAVENY